MSCSNLARVGVKKQNKNQQMKQHLKKNESSRVPFLQLETEKDINTLS